MLVFLSFLLASQRNSPKSSALCSNSHIILDFELDYYTVDEAAFHLANKTLLLSGSTLRVVSVLSNTSTTISKHAI